MTKVAAIYARVSSDRQKENHTIASQLAALTDYAEAHGYQVPAQWRFQDEGYSGATLLRPGLEAVRDLAAAGHLQAVLVYSPDRLSRKYAYQVLLAEELSRGGVELVFLQAPSGTTREDQLLVQFQGMIAGYERRRLPSALAGANVTGPDRDRSTYCRALLTVTAMCGRATLPPRITRSSNRRRLWCVGWMRCTRSKGSASMPLPGC
jgi:predicted site-specific integrase-resolvase